MARKPDVTPPANSATMRSFVHWIRAAAPYVHAFRGKTFVIAFGGEVVADERVPRRRPRPEPAAQPRHPPRRRARLPAAGRGDPRGAGLREPLRARRARDRRRCDGLRARGRRPGARAHRGDAVARPRELADGRRAQPRLVRQLHHRQADGRRRRRRHAAHRRGAPRRHRGDPAAARRRRHRADLADRLFADRRDLQPHRRGSRDAGRRAAASATSSSS